MYRRFAGMIAVAVLLSVVALAEEDKKPKGQTFVGQVSKVDAASLTVTRTGDSGATTETFALDAATKVMIETDQDEKVKGEGGTERTRPKMAEGKASDLKVGQRVTVSYAADKKATQVLAHRAVPPRKKEGER